MTEPKFYAVGDREELYATDKDEAIKEFLEDNWTDNSPCDLPETVSVQGYAPRSINADAWLFDNVIEIMLESLDEEHGGPDGPSDYVLSDEAKQLFDAFKAQVIAEYPVWQCEPVGEAIEVDLAPYIDAAVRNM